MSDKDPIVIVGAARTPMGGFQGSLSSATAPELGANAVSAAVSRAGLKGRLGLMSANDSNPPLKLQA